MGEAGCSPFEGIRETERSLVRPLGADEVGNAGNEGFCGTEGAGEGLTAASDEARLLLIMVVNSFLKVSRSTLATACGDVKVKLWPASSATRPNFILTCAAPSLLQNKAVEPIRDYLISGCIHLHAASECGTRT